MLQMRNQGYSLDSICSYVGITRQGYHKRLKRRDTQHELLDYLESIVRKNRQAKSRAGLRTIYYKESLSTLLGVNKFEQQMSIRGHALKPYRSRIKTTDSRGHHYKYDNLIAGITISGENQIIVGDITYYQNTSGLYYIFQFQDYYTLEIKGLLGSNNMEGVNAEKCLQQVLSYNKKRKYNYLLIMHTDGGSQYRSHNFQNMLRSAQIRPSHAKNCLENGLSERENGILKNEYLVDYEIRSVKHLNRVLNEIKYQTNEVWPSKTLGYKTPKKYAEWVRTLSSNDRPVKSVEKVQ